MAHSRAPPACEACEVARRELHFGKCYGGAAARPTPWPPSRVADRLLATRVRGSRQEEYNPRCRAGIGTPVRSSKVRRLRIVRIEINSGIPKLVLALILLAKAKEKHDSERFLTCK